MGKVYPYKASFSLYLRSIPAKENPQGRLVSHWNGKIMSGPGSDKKAMTIQSLFIFPWHNLWKWRSFVTHTHTFLLLIGGLNWPFRSFEGSEDRMCSSRQKSKLIIEARKQCSCFGSRPPALYPTYVYHTTMWYYHICTCKKELMSWGREVSYHTSIKMRISWWVEAEWETEVAGAAARMDHTQGAANA